MAIPIHIVKSQPLDEVYVDDDFDSSTPGWGVTHFDMIQEGVDAVAVGGAVYVNPGTYHENVVINKDNITIMGEHKSATIIDGDKGIAFNIVSSYDVIIANFTIQNADIGIYYYDSIWGTSFDNYILNNNIGLYFDNSPDGASIEDRLSGNNVSIYFLHSDGNWIVRSELSENDIGIEFNNSHYNLVCRNNILNNNLGMKFIDSDKSCIYWNNFIDNTNAVSSTNSMNAFSWFTGWLAYQSNHWSCYTGIDDFSGKFQEDDGKDGIIDIPYNVTADEPAEDVPYPWFETDPPMFAQFNNTDYYPLKEPWHDPGWWWKWVDKPPRTISIMQPFWTVPLQLGDSFTVTGLVENELNIAYGDLLSFPMWTETATIVCDPEIQHMFITREWTGVPLCYILNIAGLDESAKEVVFYGNDNFYSSLDIQTAMDPHVMLALKANGTLLSEIHGISRFDRFQSGFRLVVPCRYGYKWVKNIERIQVVDYDCEGTLEGPPFDFDDYDEGRRPNCTLPPLVSQMIVAKEHEPSTVDPAWAYDDLSCQLISNVYETLIRFGQTDIHDRFDRFVPCLATDWNISDDGLTYTFTIREGVRWHDPVYGFVTPEDVEYSFERAMVHDKAPAWLLYEPLLGTYGANVTDPLGQGRVIDDAVTVDGNTVSFHLRRPDTPYAPYTPFIRILAQPMCSQIVCKQWCIDQGDWPGFNPIAIASYLEWVKYHDLDVSPLEDPEPVMMGTGPYTLDYWEKGVEYSLVKFDDYWGGWPADGSRGYVSRVIVKYIPEWATRKMMFLAGDADIIDVPRDNINEVFCEPGIDCTYPLWPLIVYSLLFKYQISPTSPFLGSGFDPADPYAFGEDRIPINFFADINVRKGFAHSFDGIRFLEEVYQCEAVERPTPVIPDLPYYNSSVPIYEFDLAKAEEYFRYAWGGELWEQGFNFTIPYLGFWRGTVCEIIKDNVESLNSKFHIECEEVQWGEYITHWVNCELPIFMMGWCGEYPDPHNFVHPLMHSEGSFARYQHIQYGQSGRRQMPPYGDPGLEIDNVYVDALIEAGLRTPDGAERERIYDELQQIYHEECLSVFLCQPIYRHFERDEVHGWYYNRIGCGDYLYFYTMWKEELPAEDVNTNGKIDIRDITIVAMAFGSYYMPCDIHPRWDSRADLNCDQKVDIRDITFIAMKFGYVAPPWEPP